MISKKRSMFEYQGEFCSIHYSMERQWRNLDVVDEVEEKVFLWLLF
jgi:hypothetical protein